MARSPAARRASAARPDDQFDAGAVRRPARGLLSARRRRDPQLRRSQHHSRRHRRPSRSAEGRCVVELRRRCDRGRGEHHHQAQLHRPSPGPRPASRRTASRRPSAFLGHRRYRRPRSRRVQRLYQRLLLSRRCSQHPRPALSVQLGRPDRDRRAEQPDQRRQFRRLPPARTSMSRRARAAATSCSAAAAPTAR